MKNFIYEHIGNEIFLMDGKIVETDVAYANIYLQAKEKNCIIYIVEHHLKVLVLKQRFVFKRENTSI